MRQPLSHRLAGLATAATMLALLTCQPPPIGVEVRWEGSTPIFHFEKPDRGCWFDGDWEVSQLRVWEDADDSDADRGTLVWDIYGPGTHEAIRFGSVPPDWSQQAPAIGEFPQLSAGIAYSVDVGDSYGHDGHARFRAPEARP
ncbi:MAG: hypothetical protein HYV63_03850 [Candidatus Schekmanbacteria bacterium]|nr:hypothetical protein [Candidatus Schekmanbacteria bacterium]